MADDDFWSDEDTKKKPLESDTLTPIVEVPSSEISSATDTARSDVTEATEAGDDTPHNDSDDDDNYSDDDDDDDHNGEDEDDTPRSTTSSATPRKRHKHKTKNGKFPVDMTPPDKHLKRAEKKIKKYVRHKRVEDAIREMIRCTALARIVHGEGHWKIARAHATLAAGYYDLKNYSVQAQYHSEIARTMMMSRVQTSSSYDDKADIMEVLCNIYYTLGRALAQLKKYGEGEQHLLKAEKISQERSKIACVSDDNLDDWDTNIYMALARLCGKSQKHAMSQEYFEKALDIIEDRFGKESSKLIPVHQGMGTVEQSKGKHADHEKAIEHFLKAHSISTSKYKDNSPEVAETARTLATAYSNVGEEDAETSAESYLNECLAVYQVIHGPNHEKTIDIQDELAKIMIRTDRQSEGIDLLKSTLEPKSEVYGEYSSEVAETLKLIGSVQLSQGETGKALKTLKKCHNIECLVFGTNSKKSKDTQRTIDLLLANPTLAAKHKTLADSMKERPRFNSIVNRGTALGGFKSQTY